MPLSKARNRERICTICGYSATVDLHHEREGTMTMTVFLCPSCHALITRKIKTLAELLGDSPITVALQVEASLD